MKKVSAKRARRRGFRPGVGRRRSPGLALGVPKALEREGLIPELIVGTSMGAVVGGMYAQSGSAKLVELMMKELLHSEEFREVGIGSRARGKKTRPGDRPWRRCTGG